jgi:glutamyl-tRNA synthetase
MDYQKLANLLFPDVEHTPEYYEEKFPYRKLPNGAEVTRMAPSPTGFIHLGNLYSALADERIAHRKGGVFYLRIEDTDEKRKVDGAVDIIINVLRYFDI